MLTMEESQKDKLRSEYENIRNIYTLNEFTEDTTEIPNPYGKQMCIRDRSRSMSQVLPYGKSD